ncbi:FtsX-like permease family protein [Reichenbachiella carrageenanivorans]|uniref:FtsX-like permease family protein n=1 Tax=Reichenbachiella carrageenanivorans TaxID=2979869 RepID=A0ABY6D6M1_9BACT|nr:FtsX-like permease family protein [Reichenbachiella carrageenanivorans]UXX80793.1 FtsX-like permease family protein [Reichenbachiella carrageenanivorans]
MNLPFFISKRYFFSKKKKNFINIIAIISMLVVSIGTASLIIVLSVFNGMEGLLRSIYGTFDAPLQVMPAAGKSFVPTEDLKQKIMETDGILDITEVIEDNALIRYSDAQMIVKIKGMSDNFIEQGRMKNAIRQGELKFDDGKTAYAIIGRGIQFNLGVSLRNDFLALQFFYPKNVKPGAVDPHQYYSRANIMPGGVFALEQQYDDNYVFVPISFTEKLFDYKGKRTSLELMVDPEKDLPTIQRSLAQTLGSDFVVLNSDQQHADLYKVLKIEKLFVFVIFSMIVGIASINIFFSLSMLVIEKKPDIHSLFAMGAPKQLVRKIFLFEGAIIAFIGAGSGLVLGFICSWIQKTYGIISMGISTSVTQAYPIEIIPVDFIFTALTIILITFIASIQPAIRASKQGVNKG